MNISISPGSRLDRFSHLCLLVIFCVGCSTTSKDVLEIGGAQLDSGITLNSNQRINIYPKTSGKVYMIGPNVNAKNIEGKLLVIADREVDGKFIVFDIEEVKKITLGPRSNFWMRHGPGYSGLYPDNRPRTQDDYKIAYKWYKQAADQGDSTAMANLGLMYAEGRGVARDYLAAFEWYELADGHGIGQAKLDFLYAKAKAQQGDAQAQSDLGLMYRKANGVARDDHAAVKWYKLAARQGHAEAQFLLCGMYFVGIQNLYGFRVYKDSSRAYMWCHVAASQGDEKHVHWRDEIGERMTSRQRERGLDLARKCLEKKYKDC